MIKRIEVWDNGGIPVIKHKEYNEWIPEMIFSNLKAGSILMIPKSCCWYEWSW
jgi:DNA gyrase/topoisomerase IV subunit B